ncbi:MAG: ABC transporter substrate-binding protein [Myxococcales bacterium]|nr:ABC transporter substrate-binding protein [Myxococcales bacterium]
MSVVIVLGLALAAAPQVDADAATSMVRASVASALEALEDPALQGQENLQKRYARLRAVSDRAFDWPAMAQRSLGAHWRDLDEAQRKRFVATFVELLADHYLRQIDRFSGKERVEYVGTEPNPEGVEVKMKIVTASREEVPIHFYVGPSQRVYDVSIEGVSIANHYRGSFDRILVNSDFEGLMKRLEQTLASRAAAL